MAIVLGAKAEGFKTPRGLLRRFSQIRRDALRATAEYWLVAIFPRHFTPGNRSRYPIAERTNFYKQVIKKAAGLGQGKYVDLELKGQSRRFMLVSARVTGSTHQMTVSMRPPRYFTNPFVGTFRDQNGELKTIRKQPNKVAEVTAVNDNDREALRKTFEQNLARLIAAATPPGGK